MLAHRDGVSGVHTGHRLLHVRRAASLRWRLCRCVHLCYSDTQVTLSKDCKPSTLVALSHCSAPSGYFGWLGTWLWAGYRRTGAAADGSAITCPFRSLTVPLLSWTAFLLVAFTKIKSAQRTGPYVPIEGVRKRLLQPWMTQCIHFRESMTLFCRNTVAGAGPANFL